MSDARERLRRLPRESVEHGIRARREEARRVRNAMALCPGTPLEESCRIEAEWHEALADLIEEALRDD